MEIEIENPSGDLEKIETKKSKYQILRFELRARSLRLRSSLGCIGSEKMKNPEYFRLIKDGSFIGFKRIVTEYLSAAHTRWQLTPIPHDPEETRKLSKAAMGIETLGRERINTRVQTSEPDTKPEEQSETTPVTSSEGMVE